MKHLANFFLSLIAINLGMWFIFYNYTDQVITVWQVVVFIFSNILASWVLYIIIEYPLKAFWNWYSYNPDPLSPEEWRMANEVQAQRDGRLQLDRHEKNVIIKDWMDKRYSSSHLLSTTVIGVKKGAIFLNHSIGSIQDELKKSILRLPLKDQKLRIDKNGEFTLASPWLSTRNLYWENREWAQYRKRYEGRVISHSMLWSEYY